MKLDGQDIESAVGIKNDTSVICDAAKVICTLWTPGLPEGILSNCLVCGPFIDESISVSVFKYLRDCTLVFSETLHKV